MYGYIVWKSGVNPGWEIKVSGYRTVLYMFYSRRDAIREYRKRFGLVRKRIMWR